MKKGLIAGLIALALFVCAFFIAGIDASEPDPELEFAGCNLSFADSVYVLYAVKGSDLSGVKLLVWTEPRTDYSYGSQNYVLESIRTETVAGAQCLVFQYDKIAAKQMGEAVYARAFVEKGGTRYYSPVKKYSVLQYVYNKTGRTGMATTNQKLINLLEAMLDYGAKAQIYKDHKPDRLVTYDFYQVSVVGGTLPDCCDSGLFLPGEVVTITAPVTDDEGNAFSYWQNDAGEVAGTTESLDVTVVSANRKYTAMYGVEIPEPPASEYSTGLAYSDNGDGTCTITGIGTCTDLDVLIPPEIDGLTVTGIGVKAFENQTALTDIVIPDTVRTIGRRAFYGCTGLTEFTIPSSVTSIGTQIFYQADNIHTVYYNATYYPSTQTENPLLSNAGITKVVFGGQTMVLCSDWAALNLGLTGNVTEVEIGDGVTHIWGAYAFTGCSSLTSIVIPESLTFIGYCAFSSCTSLANVYYLGTVSEWCQISFGSGIIYSPESNPCCNGASLFIGNELLTVAYIQDGVTSIANAFNGCTSLTSIEIPDSVVNIGYCAFSSCTSLTSIEIPVSVVNIGDYAFSGCTSLTSIEIPDSVTSIGQSAFSGCTSLTSIEIPDSVTSIGQSAFSGCTSLTSIEIPDSVTSIGQSAFSGCISLTSIEIPDSVTNIRSYAFNGCTSLADVYYLGTAEDWTAINIESGNDALLNATIHFYIPPLTVTFVDYDGVTVLKEETVEGGGTATPPIVSYREGYIFTGWSPDFTGATADMTTVAQYSVNTEPTLTVRSVETAANETVEVAIMMDNNPGILGMQFSVNYDSSVLKLMSAVNGDALTGLPYTAPSRFRSGCTFLWDGVTLPGDVPTGGVVLTLTFEVSESAPAGDYTIVLTNYDGNAYDNDMNMVELNVINGVVRVSAKAV